MKDISASRSFIGSLYVFYSGSCCKRDVQEERLHEGDLVIGALHVYLCLLSFVVI
uniref:Uncharacterized protein n=1 Tax=Arundo donax TaxID=35708 RepID=A0A0A9HFK5_ARUDO